jgi:hypothetical protein
VNKTQQRQSAKGKAFNSIVKLYHPKSTWQPSEFPRDESYSEKREEKVRQIMEEYFKEVEFINTKQ